jgi:hypothetical protein
MDHIQAVRKKYLSDRDVVFKENATCIVSVSVCFCLMCLWAGRGLMMIMSHNLR